MSALQTTGPEPQPDGRLIRIEHLVKTYLLGEVEVHALRGISLTSLGGNSSRSWAPPAPANRRS